METDGDTNQKEPLKSRFSGLHTRTYEAELLISGAVVFGLFQLGPYLTRNFEAISSRLGGHQRLLALLGQTYLGLVIYSLIGAFLLHLAMRAFWIGLLGLESVFPKGIRWSRLKAGPAFIDHARKKVGPLSATIEHLDDLCSLIFSFGFMVAMVFVYSVVIMLVSAVAGFFVSRLFLGGDWFPQVFWTVFGTVMGIQIVANSLDRLLGTRVKSDGLAGRILGKLVAIGWAVSPNRWNGQIQLTLASNTSNTRMSTALLVVMLTLGFGFIGAMLVRQGAIRFDSMVYFPSTLREAGIDPQNYRSLRKSNFVDRRAPSIQNDVIEDPYLKLSIPYDPRRYNPLIREQCPDLEEFRPSGIVFGRGEPPSESAMREAVDCLASLFSIELDGRALTDLSFDFTREPGSSREAIATYFPAAELETGRHELVVLAPSREMAEGEPDAEAVKYVIPFWR